MKIWKERRKSWVLAAEKVAVVATAAAAEQGTEGGRVFERIPCLQPKQELGTAQPRKVGMPGNHRLGSQAPPVCVRPGLRVRPAPPAPAASHAPGATYLFSLSLNLCCEVYGGWLQWTSGPVLTVSRCFLKIIRTLAPPPRTPRPRLLLHTGVWLRSGPGRAGAGRPIGGPSRGSPAWFGSHRETAAPTRPRDQGEGEQLRPSGFPPTSFDPGLAHAPCPTQ
ncbi:normal mucosa of esophagus-specific gene 1 protein isoform X1 [Tamandua tetradactyla]|uniref:normal mucosa of esophagus-specific gene 1 protein isoform X1 n=1 Tax=Tamandua tetradactyla TaxID=48850 RepID=UPI004053A7D0